MKNKFKYFLIGFFLSGAITNVLRSEALVAVTYIFLMWGVSTWWPKIKEVKEVRLVGVAFNNFQETKKEKVNVKVKTTTKK